MTIREFRGRRIRRTRWWFLAGMAVFLSGMSLSVIDQDLTRVVMAVGAVVIASAVLHGHLVAFPCPVCGGSWTSLGVEPLVSILGLDAWIRSCPECGCATDGEIGDGPVPARRRVAEERVQAPGEQGVFKAGAGRGDPQTGITPADHSPGRSPCDARVRPQDDRPA